jgi:peptidyl-prolyl cis-trans isomerase B (cyclophilin B)
MKYTNYLNDENPRVSMDMGEYGVMEIELFPSVAPITAKNFLNLVEEGFYDGLIFHRVIKDFMIQGGDPTGTGMGGSKEKIKGEFMTNGVKNPLEHTKGVISMARSQNPNSASSQFFICHTNTPHLDGSYAAFGVVVSGFDVVDKIANVKTDYRDKPLNEVKIISAKRVR